jgi:Tol biopolymer transport system component
VELETIILTALEKDRETRYQTAAEMREALRRMERDTSFATGMQQLIGFLRRETILKFAALFIGLVTIGLAVYRWQASNERPFRNFDIVRLTSTGNAKKAAISPDGRYVAYALSGGSKESLWLRQVAATAAVQIARASEERYLGLAFSSDGNFLYWGGRGESVGNIYQMPLLGGQASRLIDNVDSSVAVSPDGSHLAFLRGFTQPREWALMIAETSGTGQRRLSVRNSSQRTAMDYAWFPVPAWAPNGNGLAWAAWGSGRTNLIIVPPNGGSEREIPVDLAEILALSWLPDGRGLIINGGDQSEQIWYLPYPSGEKQRITNDLNSYLGVSSTADGKALVTVLTDQVSNIWIAQNGRNTPAKQITAGRTNGARGISWTADGRIAYTSAEGGRSTISIMEADGSKPTTWVGDPSNYPRVSSDGRYVYFAFTDGASGPLSIGRMESGGVRPTRLASVPGHWAISNIDCSPDGKWLVYSSVDWTLWKVPATGGNPIRLNDSVGWAPSVSPDGKMIAFYDFDDKTGKESLAITPFVGGSVHRFYDAPARARCLRWTSNGKALLYLKDQEGVSNIWRQPLVGGPPQQVTDFKSDWIFFFDLSRDGKQLALARGTVNSDVVLIRDKR